MPFEFSQLAAIRPYLYHLTATQNLAAIVKELELRCARTQLERAGKSHEVSIKRQDHIELPFKSGTARIRDQKPLIEGAIAFEEGWDLARFVAHVNEHVFFWPGGPSGPVRSGLNHFDRYRVEGPAILRVRTESMLGANLKFCRYNSGAPRCSGGKYSPRGSRTYLPAREFPGIASEVVEVVAVGACILLGSVEVSFSPTGPWRPLDSAV
jgi:hypothetical protein